MAHEPVEELVAAPHPHLEGVEDELGAHRGGHSPADNEAAVESTTKATSTVLDQVATEVKSLSHRAFGRGAPNIGLTRSGGRAAVLSSLVLHLTLPRTTPQMPSSRMSRATRSRPTSWPSRWSCFQRLRAP